MEKFSEKLGWALYISESWYDSWVRYRNMKDPLYRRMALKHKTYAMIRFDRVMDYYDTPSRELIFDRKYHG